MFLLRLILLGFLMLILRGVGLTERAHMIFAIFSDLFLYVGQLVNNLLLHSPPQRPSMYLLLPDTLDNANHERLWSDLQECTLHV
jgi:hypothetical protein